jgi:hypothetical protein
MKAKSLDEKFNDNKSDIIDDLDLSTMTRTASLLTVYGLPQSRSLRTTWLLEELGQPYDYQLVDLSKNEHR